jgi:hypothetical protein
MPTTADDLWMGEPLRAPGQGVAMPVAALSTAGFSQYISASSNVSASQQAWQSLQQSLTAGNLSAAHSAFNAYNQLTQGSTAANSASSSSSASSQLSTDMAALGSAIGSGSLSSARSAFAAAQSDQKFTPSQAIANAESAVTQTVQWVDDLLSLSNSSNPSNSLLVDPTTAMLDSAYGLNTNSSTTNPTVALLESKYGDGSSTGSASSASASNTTSGSSATAPAIATSGNSGSAASVNAYA